MENTLLFIERKLKKLEGGIALGMKSHLGWRELTFKGLDILSKRLANYLIEIGIDKGDKLSILSESMPEWGAALFASTMAGSITIPLDIKLTEYELTSILTDCQPKVMLVSSTYLQMAIKLKETIKSIEHIIIINDAGSIKDYPSIYTLDDKPNRKWRHRNINSTALIIYTSGTTGNPKGVEISFRNILAQVKAMGPCFNMGPNDRLLSILPMNHLFELTVGFLTFLSLGTSIYYSKSLKPKDIFELMEEKQITFMIVVPAFMKLLESSIHAELRSKSMFARRMFDIKYQLAKFIKFKKIKKLMFKDIHKKFGGKFKGFLSGGAPLDIKAAKFFENIGMTIYEGYGLSEASPVVSLNTDEARKLGSVGKPLPNVDAKIDPETGELLVKGDNVMKGYYNKPDMTDEVITPDGWLHTGDIAKIDKDGFIWITGRIKNMIVLSGGKKVFPEEIEALLEKNPNFQEVCALGAKRKNGQKDGCEDIYVFVYPKQYVIDERGGNMEEVEKFIKAEVKEMSKQLSHFKRPNNIYIMNQPMPRTATSKIKRREIKKMFNLD